MRHVNRVVHLVGLSTRVTAFGVGSGIRLNGSKCSEPVRSRCRCEVIGQESGNPYMAEEPMKQWKLHGFTISSKKLFTFEGKYKVSGI